MISLKKFLAADQADHDAEHALWRSVHLLIEGVAQHAAVGDANACERFRQTIGRISQALLEEITPEELVTHSSAVVKALEEQQCNFDRWRGEHDTEFRNMVKMLTSTVAVISATSDTNVTRLTEIEHQVVSASKLDDVRLIKSRLADCLDAIRNESDRQRQKTSESLEHLKNALSQANAVNDTLLAEPDPITGLPQRPAAEAALSQAGHGKGYVFAAILVLDKLQALNVRFGRSVGDEVLKVFASVVQKKLPAADRLFRWGGPALFALIRHAGNIEQARGDVGRIVDAKLEHRIETPSRNILIPIGARWAVFPMMAEPQLLCQRIDTFASVVTRE